LLIEQAEAMGEQAEAMGEPLEDPLPLFSVLYGLWVARYVEFDGDAVSELAVPGARPETGNDITAHGST